MSRRPIGDLERFAVLGILAIFAVLAAASFIEGFINTNYHPDTALTGIATAIVGAAVTHLLIRRRNGGDE